MIPNGERWRYQPPLLRRITSKHHGAFYFLNCLHSFATEKNLNRIKNNVKIKIFVMQLYLLKTLKY